MPGFVPAVMGLFSLQNTPEAFHRVVVVAIPFPAHGEALIPNQSNNDVYSRAKYWLLRSE